LYREHKASSSHPIETCFYKKFIIDEKFQNVHNRFCEEETLS
jgi:hypothetical protein